MMRRAIAESEMLERQKQQELIDEEEMIKQAILLSQQEEEQRVAKIKALEDEQIAVAQKLSSAEATKQMSKVEIAAAKVSANALEQKKEVEVERLKVQQSLPPLGGSALPQIGQRQGVFNVDKAQFAKAQAEMDALVAGQTAPAKADPQMSMAEAARAKRAQTEQAIDASKKQTESVEERKARLLAQRDLLREHKKK